MKNITNKEIPALLKAQNTEIVYEGISTNFLHVMPETSTLFKRLIEQHTVKHDVESPKGVEHDLEIPDPNKDIVKSQDATKNYIHNKKRSVRLQRFKQYTDL